MWVCAVSNDTVRTVLSEVPADECKRRLMALEKVLWKLGNSVPKNATVGGYMSVWFDRLHDAIRGKCK